MKFSEYLLLEGKKTKKKNKKSSLPKIDKKTGLPKNIDTFVNSRKNSRQGPFYGGYWGGWGLWGPHAPGNNEGSDGDRGGDE